MNIFHRFFRWHTPRRIVIVLLLAASTAVGVNQVGIAAVLRILGGIATAIAQVTWPSSGDAVISNGTNSPAGLSPTNNDLVYSTGGAFANLSTADSSVLVTSSGGVPSLSTSLPSGLTIPGYNASVTWPTSGDLMLSDGGNAPTAYGGSTCTSGKFATALSAAGVATCSTPSGTTMGVETPTFTDSAYTLSDSDANMYVLIGGQASATAAVNTIDLPAGSDVGSAGTVVVIANISDTTSVPILLAGTPTLDCGGTGAETCTADYTVATSGDLVRHHITWDDDVSLSSVVYSDTDCSLLSDTHANSGSPDYYQSELVSCPDISSGAKTFTLTFSGSTGFTWDGIVERSGAATSSPDDEGNEGAGTGSGAGAVVSLALAGAVSERGEVIDAGFNDVTGTTPTVGQVGYSYLTGGFGDEYLLTNGAALYTMSWTLGGADAYVASAAGIKPANPSTVVDVCPTTGSDIYGTAVGTAYCGDSGYSGVPVPPGYSLTLTVDSNGDYFAQLHPPQSLPKDDYTSSFTANIQACRMNNNLLTDLSALTVTVPTTLPPGCIIPLEQAGAVADEVTAGTGMCLASAGGGHCVDTDDYTGGQNTQSNVTVGAGNSAIFGGAVAAPP